MKLLFDQNLSPRLIRTLSSVYTRRGNCSTAEVEEILRNRQPDLLAFERDEHGAFLALG